MFTIILPTHKRPDLVLRSIKSVQTQTCSNWQLFVIIDDTVSDYRELINIINEDSRIRLIKNEENVGKNASLNRALTLLALEQYTGHIIFLDDDDWLAPECLADFNKNKEHPWVVSERFDVTSKKSLTRSTISGTKINYLTDMLLMRNFYGETTHCIYFPPVANVRFPALIKNAEEWIYFAGVAKTLKSFMYLSSTGTFSEGYLDDGLSLLKTSSQEKIRIMKLLMLEVWQKKIISLFVYIYIAGRILKTLFQAIAESRLLKAIRN